MARKLTPVSPWPGHYNTAPHRVYEGVIIFNTSPGDLRAARSVVAQALRNIVGSRLRHDARSVHYTGVGRDDLGARYDVRLTGHELDILGPELKRLARLEGFDRIPADSTIDIDVTGSLAEGDLQRAFGLCRDRCPGS